MKNMLLANVANTTQKNVNVVAIDWSLAAKSPYYYQSAFNTKTVGKMIACVVNRLKAIGLKPENVDLYGQSLGAHVVGFAGKGIVGPKARFIIGADPAAPGFQGYPDTEKLAYSDASFVNVIHTNGISNYQVPVVQGEFPCLIVR